MVLPESPKHHGHIYGTDIHGFTLCTVTDLPRAHTLYNRRVVLPASLDVKVQGPFYMSLIPYYKSFSVSQSLVADEL